jgi:lactoylglutathione lyase
MRPNIAEFTDKFGIILFVEKFHECEKFYAEIIGLRIFGNGYLMLEGEDGDSRKAARGSFVIRFNVKDLIGAASYLEQRGVEVVIHHFDWGSIAAFTDPDGNRCELKTPLAR